MSQMILAEDWGPLVYQTILVVIGIPIGLMVLTVATIYVLFPKPKKHDDKSSPSE